MSIEFYHDTETDNRLLRRATKWIVDLAVVFTLALFLVLYMGMQYAVSGHSMEPTLYGGDVVLVDRISYRLRRPKRLELVVFQKRDDEDRQYLKRIIGLPGETVQIKGGQIYIDGGLLKLPESLSQVNLAGLAEEPVMLGEGEYFLLGDNRDSSEDSRFENIGNVSIGQITGKAWFRPSPLERIGFLNSTDGRE